MSDFFETEAQESEDEENVAASVDSSDEDEEEEDDNAIDPALQDFIRDDEEEEGEAESDKNDDDDNMSGKRKREREAEEDEDIDDDDYDLIEENLGVKLKKKKKFSRIKLDSDDEQEEDNDIPEAKKAIEKVLFHAEDSESGSDVDSQRAAEKKKSKKLEKAREKERTIQQQQTTAVDDDDEESDDESDVNDFIVDDEGVPMSRKKKSKKKGVAAMTDENLAEAQELFGADFELEDLNKVYRGTTDDFYAEEDDDDFEEGYDRYEEEMDEDDADFIEDEDGQTLRAKMKKAKAEKTKREAVRKLVQFDPSMLEKGHYLPEDERIKSVDIPERFQLRQIPVEFLRNEEEAMDEAQWIFNQAFMKEYISTQNIKRPSHNGGSAYDGSTDASVEGKQAGEFYGFNTNKSPETVIRIRDVLKLLRDQLHEVPFIHCYRREYCEPELNEIYDLWTIWQSDEKWMQLQRRKTKLTTLFMDMKNYLDNLTRKCEDYSRIAEIRPLEEFDIAQLKSADTMLQVEDVYQHFLLHYGHYIAAMHETKKVQKPPPKKDPVEGEEDKEDNEEEAAPESETPAVKLKRPQRKQLYHICIKNKIYNFSNLFGMSPEQFGVNITDGFQRHDPTTCSQYPSDVALELICDAFANKEAVINAAVYMVAQQLCHEPLVRKAVRKNFEEKVGINVRPTKKGMREIDELHSLFPMKYLKGKEVSTLKDAEFLHLVDAEKQSLIQMSFKIRDDIPAGSNPEIYGLEGFIEDLALMYQEDGFSEVVREWNELRRKAVRMAVEKLLFPILESELRDKLLKEAQDYVIRESVCRLHTMINIQPWLPNSGNTQMTDDEGDYEVGARVISIAYSDESDEPSYAVYLDKHGIPRDYLRLPNMMRTNKGSQLEVKLREQDFSSLSDFFQRVRPHTAVVCTSSMRAKTLIIGLEDMLQTLETEFSFPSVGLELVNDDLAAVYEKSSKGRKEFPTYPMLLKRAISAGRRLQDPLVEFCQLCDDENDLLSFKFHPDQSLVPKDDLLEALTTEFVSMTNKVGVDVNRCLDYPHYAPVLQFVCGLGPRKASAIVQLLNRKNLKLANRTQLVTEVQMGPKIFVNCAGFIKIDVHSFDSDAADDETWLDPLDSTRIHPETYEWARKMAVDALEYDDVEGDEQAQQKTARAVEEIMETPDKLKDLDLDAFAEELDRQGYGKKNITLYDINLELSNGFKDRFRRLPQSPSEVERFEMLTKETLETLCIGKLVLVTATEYVCRYPNEKDVGDLEKSENGFWKCPFCGQDTFEEIAQVWSHFDSKTCQGKPSGVRVRLETGLSGTILLQYLSDSHVERPEEKVQIGQTFYARIRTLDVHKFRCTLTSRTSDLIDKSGEYAPMKDESYDFTTETYDKDIAKAERDKRQQTKQYMKRVIVHPNFANVTYEECIKRLNYQDQGDCLFRPSSKGPGYLTCTWKVEDGIFQHILIEEQRQENSFSLGKTLVINNQEYEDLDEVIATYIKPMALMVRELSQYKYYYKPTEDKTAIERELLQQKMTNPSKIPYYLTACVKRPGFFYLVYLPRKTVVWEYVTISPNGFKYRDHVFSTLNQLLAWFKVHFRDPRPDMRPKAPQPHVGIGINADYGGNMGATPSRSHQNALFDQARRTPMASMNDNFPNTNTYSMSESSGSHTRRQNSISPPMMQSSRHPGSSSQRMPSADSYRPHSDYGGGSSSGAGYSSKGHGGGQASSSQMTPSYSNHHREGSATPRHRSQAQPTYS